MGCERSPTSGCRSAVGGVMEKQDLIHMIGLEMAQSRIGSKDVFMDGKHLPGPSELERARQLYEELDFAIREQIAKDALEFLKQMGGDECGCPAYPDGETWDGHMCFKFQLLDLITKDERVSDRIDKENKNV